MEAKESATPIAKLTPDVASTPKVGWIVESEDSSIKWMCELVTHHPWRPLVELTPLLAAVDSSSSKYVVVPDVDRVGSSSTAELVVSFNTSSKKDLDDPYYPRTPFEGCSL